MQLEMTHASCPLCKRALPIISAANALDTKLCEKCRIMVQTAFGRGDSRLATSSIHNDVTIAQVPLVAPTLDHANSQTFVGDKSSIAELFVQPRFVQYEPDLDHRDAGEARALDQDDTVPDPIQNSERAQGSLRECEADELPFPNGVVAADPWGHSLASWDYSGEEWPVLVTSGRSKSSAKLTVPFIVIALLASASGLYFVMSQPGSRAQHAGVTNNPPTTERVPATAEHRAASARSDEAPNQAASPSLDTPATAGTNSQGDARDLPGSNEENNSQGRFSLQAAAFPTQSASDEFAEKLKRAGVPSYVVSRDLAKRGRWFRVRIGRFKTAEGAQRFAAEAQRRARAGGMSIQLFVCPYEDL